MHKNVRSSMVKAVFELDASLRNYNKKTKEIILDTCMDACVNFIRLCQLEVLLAREFLYGNELIFIHPTTNFYTTSAQKAFLRILTIVSLHSIGHHMPRFKILIFFFKNIFTMDLESCTKISGVQW